MVKSRILLTFFLAIFIIALPAFSFSADEVVTQAETVKQTETTQTPRKGKEIVVAEITEEDSYSSNVISSLLESQERDIDLMEIEVAELTQEIQEGLPKLRAIRLQIESEFNSIVLINNANSVNPTEMNLLAKQMRRFNYELNKFYLPFTSTRVLVDDRLVQLAAITSTLEAIDTEESKLLLERISLLNEKYTLLDKRLDNALPRVETLVNSISQAYSEFEKIMPSLWLDFYVNNNIDLLNINFWENELYNLVHLPETAFNTFINGIPSGLNQWLSLLTSAIFSAIIVAFVTFTSSKIVTRLPEHAALFWEENCKHILRTSFPWIVFGYVLYTSAWSDAGYYQIIAGISCFSLVYGQIKFSWQLYTLARLENSEIKSPYMPMLRIIIVSLALLTFIPLQLTLSLIWLVFLLIFIVRSRPLMKTCYTLPLYIIRFFYFILGLGVLLTIAGLVHLSIFLVLLYICLAIGLHQIAAFMHISQLIQEKLPQNGIPALVAGLVVSIVLPIFLLIALISPIAWVFVYPGGEYLIMNFSNFAIGFGKFSFNATQLLKILIAFYLCKSLITVCCNYIDSTWNNLNHHKAASLSTPIKTTIVFGLWGFFALYVLHVIGFSLTSLAFIAGGLSVGIGLGLQSIMQNIFSGFSLIFGQNIREGDVVEVAGILGVVKKVSLRATQVRTYDNAVVFVPNSEFLATTFINWTHNGRMVRSIVAVGVAYDSDLDLVKQLARDVLTEHQKVLNHPAPLILLQEFGASSIDFEFRFWIKDIDEGLTIRADVRTALVQKFRENNIEIPFPQTDLHIRSNLTLPQKNS